MPSSYFSMYRIMKDKKSAFHKFFVKGEITMSLYKMETTLEAVNGGDNTVILVAKKLMYAKGSDGKATDTIESVRLDVLLPKSRMNALAVKFTTDPLPKLTDEEIAQACADLAPPIVQLEGTTVKLYSNPTGGLVMTATAETAKIISLE